MLKKIKNSIKKAATKVKEQITKPENRVKNGLIVTGVGLGVAIFGGSMIVSSRI